MIRYIIVLFLVFGFSFDFALFKANIIQVIDYTPEGLINKKILVYAFSLMMALTTLTIFKKGNTNLLKAYLMYFLFVIGIFGFIFFNFYLDYNLTFELLCNNLVIVFLLSNILLYVLLILSRKINFSNNKFDILFFIPYFLYINLDKVSTYWSLPIIIALLLIFKSHRFINIRKIKIGNSKK